MHLRMDKVDNKEIQTYLKSKDLQFTPFQKMYILNISFLDQQISTKLQKQKIINMASVTLFVTNQTKKIKTEDPPSLII